MENVIILGRRRYTDLTWSSTESFSMPESGMNPLRQVWL